MQPIELLAILGRGIQQIVADEGWTLTDNLEMCDEKGAHLPVRIPADDANPYCLIGGGELNLRAGVVLCREYVSSLKAVVCAYGARSEYLARVGGPSESEIMSARLEQLLTPAQEPNVVVWPRDHIAQDERGKSGSGREIQNVFELAVERGWKTVGLVTIAVHYARALLMAQRHLMNPRFAHLTLQCYVSEELLLAHDLAFFGPLVREMHGSKAFMRSFFLEQRGINCLIAGNY